MPDKERIFGTVFTAKRERRCGMIRRDLGKRGDLVYDIRKNRQIPRRRILTLKTEKDRCGVYEIKARAGKGLAVSNRAINWSEGTSHRSERNLGEGERERERERARN